MAITILETLEETSEGVRARIRHGDSDLIAILVGDVDRATRSAKPVIVEMDYDSIITCHTLDEFDDADSGIWQGRGDSALLRGRVAQVIGDKDDSLIDLYLQQGPEFFLFRASHAKVDELSFDMGIEVQVEGLRFLLPSG